MTSRGCTRVLYLANKLGHWAFGKTAGGSMRLVLAGKETKRRTDKEASAQRATLEAHREQDAPGWRGLPFALASLGKERSAGDDLRPHAAANVVHESQRGREKGAPFLCACGPERGRGGLSRGSVGVRVWRRRLSHCQAGRALRRSISVMFKA
eukprot:g11371.t1